MGAEESTFRRGRFERSSSLPLSTASPLSLSMLDCKNILIFVEAISERQVGRMPIDLLIQAQSCSIYSFVVYPLYVVACKHVACIHSSCFEIQSVPHTPIIPYTVPGTWYLYLYFVIVLRQYTKEMCQYQVLAATRTPVFRIKDTRLITCWRHIYATLRTATVEPTVVEDKASRSRQGKRCCPWYYVQH